MGNSLTGNVDENFEKGMLAYRINDYDTAKTYFDLSRKKHHANSVYMLGKVELAKGDNFKALNHFQKAYELGVLESSYQIVRLNLDRNSETYNALAGFEMLKVALQHQIPEAYYTYAALLFKREITSENFEMDGLFYLGIAYDLRVDKAMTEYPFKCCEIYQIQNLGDALTKHLKENGKRDICMKLLYDRQIVKGVVTEVIAHVEMLYWKNVNDAGCIANMGVVQYLTRKSDPTEYLKKAIIRLETLYESLNCFEQIIKKRIHELKYFYADALFNLYRDTKPGEIILLLKSFLSGPTNYHYPGIELGNAEYIIARCYEKELQSMRKNDNENEKDIDKTKIEQCINDIIKYSKLSYQKNCLKGLCLLVNYVGVNEYITNLEQAYEMKNNEAGHILAKYSMDPEKKIAGLQKLINKGYLPAFLTSLILSFPDHNPANDFLLNDSSLTLINCIVESVDIDIQIKLIKFVFEKYKKGAKVDDTKIFDLCLNLYSRNILECGVFLTGMYCIGFGCEKNFAKSIEIGRRMVSLQYMSLMKFLSETITIDEKFEKDRYQGMIVALKFKWANGPAEKYLEYFKTSFIKKIVLEKIESDLKS